MKLPEPKVGSTKIIAGMAGAALLLAVACGTSASPAEPPSQNEPAPLVRNVEVPKPSNAAAANEPSSTTSSESPSEGNQPGQAMTSEGPVELENPVTADQPVKVTAEASVETEMQPAAETVPVGNNVGERVPDFTIRLIDGSTVTSAELLQEGQPTFLFFFESW